MRIIDAHNHPYHCYNMRAMLDNMAQYNIDCTWLLSWECPPDEIDPSYTQVMPIVDSAYPIPHTLLRQYKERAIDLGIGSKFVLGYAPDPRRPQAIDWLESAIKTDGVKVCGEVKLRMMYDNWDAVRLFRYAGEQGLPVIVHLDYEFPRGTKYPRPNYWYGGGIEAFERTLRSCPGTNFLGHAPGFWAHISGDDKYDKEPYPKGPVLPNGKLVQMLRQYPNLYCDISAGSGHNALSRDLEFTKGFLIEFQDRIVYSRDYFDNKHQELLNSLSLPEDTLARIYAGNALRLIHEA